MQDCMKRRLLFACRQAYQPKMYVAGRSVGWLDPPIVIQREGPIGHRHIDCALVGRVAEGVVIAFRGSLPPFFDAADYDGWAVVLDWLNDAMSLCVDDPVYGGGVHLGLAQSLERLWRDDMGPGLHTAIQAMLDQSLLDRKARLHLFVTGHSKGGALANLCALRAARVAAWRHAPVSAATVGAPRVGNAAFARAYGMSRVTCLRYELAGDPVPQLPLSARTPAWVGALARAAWPRLAAADYRPVGTAMRAGAGEGYRRWQGSRRPLARLLDRRGAGLIGMAIPALAAHAICPGSGYDRLVCEGEGACDHGGTERFRLRA